MLWKSAWRSNFIYYSITIYTISQVIAKIKISIMFEFWYSCLFILELIFKNVDYNRIEGNKANHNEKRSPSLLVPLYLPSPHLSTPGVHRRENGQSSKCSTFTPHTISTNVPEHVTSAAMRWQSAFREEGRGRTDLLLFSNLPAEFSQHLSSSSLNLN